MIIEETKRFNAIGANGFGFFYGANAKEQRHIIPHGIINKILNNPEESSRLYHQTGMEIKSIGCQNHFGIWHNEEWTASPKDVVHFIKE